MELQKELLATALQAAVTADLMAERVDGVALTVTQHGQTVYENYFGKAKHGSLFRIASMTKPITALAVLILADRGLLRL